MREVIKKVLSVFLCFMIISNVTTVSNMDLDSNVIIMDGVELPYYD